MTPIDFVESTIAGALGTHHPYHWMVISAKWVCIHIAIVWGSFRSSAWIVRIWNVFCDWLCSFIISRWK